MVKSIICRYDNIRCFIITHKQQEMLSVVAATELGNIDWLFTYWRMSSTICHFTWTTLYSRVQNCWLKLLLPHVVMWPLRSDLTLIQLMAYWMEAPSHYLSLRRLISVRSCGIHLRAMSQGIPEPPVITISLIIAKPNRSCIPGDHVLTFPWNNVTGTLYMIGTSLTHSD